MSNMGAKQSQAATAKRKRVNGGAGDSADGKQVTISYEVGDIPKSACNFEWKLTDDGDKYKGCMTATHGGIEYYRESKTAVPKHDVDQLKPPSKTMTGKSVLFTFDKPQSVNIKQHF